MTARYRDVDSCVNNEWCGALSEKIVAVSLLRN